MSPLWQWFVCLFNLWVFHVVDLISLNSSPLFPLYPKLFVLFDKILCYLDLSRVHDFKLRIFVHPTFWKDTFGLSYMSRDTLFDFFNMKRHIFYHYIWKDTLFMWVGVAMCKRVKKMKVECGGICGMNVMIECGVYMEMNVAIECSCIRSVFVLYF
jgi:hypothetical protein